MPRIIIDAQLSVRYFKTITKAQLRRLNEGDHIEDVTDVDCDAYAALATDGSAEADWEVVPCLSC